jgi:hypothetical protein
MQRRLRDQRIIIIHPKHLGALQSLDNERDRLQLRTALGDVVFVYCERLDVEIVGEVFESAFVGDLGGEEEETEGDCRRFDLGAEDGSELAHEFEDVFYFGFPVVLLEENEIDGLRVVNGVRSHHMFAILVSPTELDRSRDEGRECEPHAFTSSFEMSSSRLEELQFNVRITSPHKPATQTDLKLYIKRLRPEQMNHSCHPTLFLCQFVPLQMIRCLSPHIFNTRLRASTTVRLIFNQDMT